MESTSRQFRIFVSSTFSDFKHEREALQERVFPALRAYCEKRGAHFQAIDLRWGISEEAARENRTVRICLEEIHRSQRLSPRPNFIILLGNRYGWHPTPDEIPAAEFEALIQNLSATDAELVNHWYRRDDNAVPPVYYLHTSDTGHDEAEHLRLAAVLRDAALTAGFPEPDRLKYFASATHLEIHEGLLKTPDADRHVFAYCRDIENLPQDVAAVAAEDFIDITDGTIDTDATTSLADLKQQVREHLPGHFHDYPARWLGKEISQDHIGTFCADVEADLKSVIDRELEQLDSIDPLEWNAEQHRSFGVERARVFVGRQEPLQKIADYLSSETTAPLVIHGPGGIGKSALLAKAIEQIDTNQYVVMQRFIGATPDSSQLRGLLTSLSAELGRRYGAEETVQYEKLEELITLFETRLNLATSERPLVLVIDSLDQLETTDMAHQLRWLPQSLPAYVHIIVSTRETQTDRACHPVYAATKQHYAKSLLALGPLNSKEGAEALDALLGPGRTLTDIQRRSVLTAFAESGLPLYLKLAVEQARQWRSDTPAPDLPATVLALIRNLFEHLQQPVNHGPVFVERALAYLQAGRYGGLEEDELTRALALDTEVVTEFHARSLQPWDRPELPPILWSRLRADLAPYLTEQSVDGTLLHRFFHREFAEVIEENMLADDVGKVRHSTLAEAFTWHIDPAAFRSAEESPALRQMMELPYQLRRAGRTDDLDALLTDFNFAYTKCAANRSDDLVNDYLRASTLQQTTPGSDLNVWIQFMHSRAHLLMRGTPEWPAHKILQQLAVEHADDSPVTQAAEAWLKTSECDWLWFRSAQRPKAVDKDPCLAVMEGHTGIVHGALALANRRILSWSDNTLRIWSYDGVPLAIMAGHASLSLKPKILVDGRILSWSDDNTLKIWSSDGSPLVILDGHTKHIPGVKILSDGRILSWSYDSTLRLWSPDGVSLAVMAEHTNAVMGVQLLSDGRILSWSDDTTLRLWSPDGDPLAVMDGHKGLINGAQELADRRILSWSEDTTLRFWSFDGAPLAVLEGHTGRIDEVRVLADKRILSWSYVDYILRLWSPDGEPLAIMEGHYGYLDLLADDLFLDAQALADGRILSWSDDNTPILWSRDGELLTILEGHIGSVLGVMQLTDGRILSWSRDATLRLWTFTGKPIMALQGHLDAVCGVQVLADGRILSWSMDATLRLWSTDGTPLAVMEGHTFTINGAQELADRRILSWSDDSTLRLWSIEEMLLVVKRVNNTHGGIQGAQVLADKRIITWPHNHALQLWSQDGMPLAIMEGHTGSIYRAQELADGHILSWSNDHTLRLWSRDGMPLAVMESKSDGGIRGAHVLSDGRILSHSPMNKQVWSPEGTLLTVMENHSDHDVQSAQALADGKIVYLFWSNTLRLWSPDRKLFALLRGHKKLVNGFQLLANGHILSWSDDKTLRIWSSDGVPLAILADHTGSVKGAQVLADGRILSWSYDSTLRLWSSDGVSLAVMEGHTATITGARVLANACILSWADDKTLRLWSPNGEPLAVMEGPTGSKYAIPGVQVLPSKHILVWLGGKTLRLWNLSSTHELALTDGSIHEVSNCIAMSYEPYIEPYKSLLRFAPTDHPFGVWVLTHRVPLFLRLYSGNKLLNV